MTELVSILIPVHNCEKWVGRAIETALNQTWPAKEIIVLDDGSTDKSLEVIEGWKGKVHIARSSVNRGQNVSRNALTDLSKGNWLLYLDADDELSPDAVAKKMTHADTVDAIYGTITVNEYNGDELTSTAKLEAISFSDPVSAAFLWKYPNTSAFMFRRSALTDVGGWNENIQNCTDYDLYFRLMLAEKKVLAAPESVTVYRHWSTTQAVYENRSRLVFTRLELLWHFALELEHRGRMTEENCEAFSNMALNVIRTVYQIDPVRALHEHRRLKSWNPRLTPSTEHFPKGFCVGYRLFGFGGAELLAGVTRVLRPRPPAAAFTLSQSRK